MKPSDRLDTIADKLEAEYLRVLSDGQQTVSPSGEVVYTRPSPAMLAEIHRYLKARGRIVPDTKPSSPAAEQLAKARARLSLTLPPVDDGPDASTERATA